MWKTIAEAPRYEINENGEIRSVLRKTSPTVRRDRDGYCTTWLLIEKGRPLLHRRVHRLVAETFIPNPEGLPEVNHINHVRDDNRAVNLEWCTTAQNVTDAKGHKITARYKEEIVGKFDSIRAAARSIGMSGTMVGYCLYGRYPSAKGYSFEYAK